MKTREVGSTGRGPRRGVLARGVATFWATLPAVAQTPSTTPKDTGARGTAYAATSAAPQAAPDSALAASVTTWLERLEGFGFSGVALVGRATR